MTQVTIRSDIVLLAGDAVLTQELASGQLVRLDVTELQEPRSSGLLMAQFGMLRLKGRTLSPAATTLMDMVRAEAERILITPRRPAAAASATRRGQKPSPHAKPATTPRRRSRPATKGRA